MKKNVFYPIIILFICIFVCVASWWVSWGLPPARYVDPFYNVNYDDYPLVHLPLIKPIRASRILGESPWGVSSPDGPWVRIPNRQDIVYYDYSINELEKIAVKNGVVMAYSAYVDKEADAYVLDNYYHWFVFIPETKIAEGFHTEDELNQYIETLGIQNPEWQTPDEAYKQFTKTGCLEWIPNCN